MGMRGTLIANSATVDKVVFQASTPHFRLLTAPLDRVGRRVPSSGSLRDGAVDDPIDSRDGGGAGQRWWPLVYHRVNQLSQ